ncbi:DUF6296 family protein [Streptomyces hydrogenans]|uniref:DUF6296 family protein n=1 Tax=Streptomyces hydrogenans TaxID=1873719 RepID=UPI001983B4C8|nr:DUF6296 family protein [Streptomyces hydrogenans]GHG11676.1 hypothetical protein GCM10018784_25480 [Streptomyces hydrogenans]
MNPVRYELVFSDDTGSAQDVAIVERTSSKGPGGHPVYADPTGIIRAEISDRDEVRILASGGHQDPAQRVLARRLTPTDTADSQDPSGPSGKAARPEAPRPSDRGV